MQVRKVREGHSCGYKSCPGRELEKGTLAVTTSTKGKAGWYTLYFHIDCYLAWYEEYVRWWVRKAEEKETERQTKKEARMSKRPRGRPRKSTDPLRYNGLRTLRDYHERKGNKVKVREIEAQMKELEV